MSSANHLQRFTISALRHFGSRPAEIKSFQRENGGQSTFSAGKHCEPILREAGDQIAATIDFLPTWK